jgi:FixJ family two-component response regulator
MWEDRTKVQYPFICRNSIIFRMVKSLTLVSIVDDDSSVRRALGRMVSSLGYRVKTFASAREYLEKSRSDPACLILDVVMPEMTGFDLFAKLQKSGRAVPTVFISAHTSEKYREEARLLSAHRFLQKPFEESMLLDAIKESIASNNLPNH